MISTCPFSVQHIRRSHSYTDLLHTHCAAYIIMLHMRCVSSKIGKGTSRPNRDSELPARDSTDRLESSQVYIVRSRSKLALDNPGAAPTEPLFMHHVVGPDECPLQSTLPLAFRERDFGKNLSESQGQFDPVSKRIVPVVVHYISMSISLSCSLPVVLLRAHRFASEPCAVLTANQKVLL